MEKTNISDFVLLPSWYCKYDFEFLLQKDSVPFKAVKKEIGMYNINENGLSG